ncbi:MAG: hypothetical protein JSR58_04330 [Verrucomicrobia bacterium]|nr:hypothetical protein [Verrucomicrobiota bacterium]
MSGSTPPAAPLRLISLRQIKSSFASACRASPHSFGSICLCDLMRLVVEGLLARAVPAFGSAASARRHNKGYEEVFFS